jgi:hypothetical protein
LCLVQMVQITCQTTLPQKEEFLFAQPVGCTYICNRIVANKMNSQ